MSAAPTANNPALDYPALLRLHAAPAFKVLILVAIAAATVRYSGHLIDQSTELWTARFGTDAQKIELARHYQQELAERHGWHLYTADEMRRRFASRGVPEALLSDSIPPR